MNTAAILYFTDSPEKDASLESATDIELSIGKGAYKLPLTILNWKEQVLKLDTTSLCFLASHGDIGEDGTLHQFLENNHYLHTHSSAKAAAILAHKHNTKILYRALAIPTPNWKFLGKMYATDAVCDDYVRKPLYGGSKKGIIRTNIALETAMEVLYEVAVEGNLEVSIVVVRKDDDHIALSPIVRSRDLGNIGDLSEVDSSLVSSVALKNCQLYAELISQHLDCFGVTKTDFVIDKKGNPLAIETDSIPGLSQRNAASHAAARSNISYNDLLRIIMENIYRV